MKLEKKITRSFDEIIHLVCQEASENLPLVSAKYTAKDISFDMQAKTVSLILECEVKDSL